MGTLASTYRHRVPWQTTTSIERQLSTWPCLSAAACHPRRSAVHTKIVNKGRRESFGDCGYCNGHYCGTHRLLEDHKCDGLEDCKKESHDRNAAQLNAERTHVIKGI